MKITTTTPKKFNIQCSLEELTLIHMGAIANIRLLMENVGPAEALIIHRHNKLRKEVEGLLEINDEIRTF